MYHVPSSHKKNNPTPDFDNAGSVLTWAIKEIKYRDQDIKTLLTEQEELKLFLHKCFPEAWVLWDQVLSLKNNQKGEDGNIQAQ